MNQQLANKIYEEFQGKENLTTIEQVLLESAKSVLKDEELIEKEI